MWQDNCTHCSRPLYVRDLNIYEFWYLQGSWNKSPQLPRDNYKVLEQCLAYVVNVQQASNIIIIIIIGISLSAVSLQTGMQSGWKGWHCPLSLSAPKPPGSWRVE